MYLKTSVHQSVSLFVNTGIQSTVFLITRTFIQRINFMSQSMLRSYLYMA